MEPIRFTKWGGEDGIEHFIIQQTGCKPFSGAGINPRISHGITILKSVDNTYYYDDDLSDFDKPKYTLFGHNGDQDETEAKFNEPLLNKEKTKFVYLYRVKNVDKKKEYYWYGKYVIDSQERRRHIGMDNNLRSIVVLSLKRDYS